MEMVFCPAILQKETQYDRIEWNGTSVEAL